MRLECKFVDLIPQDIEDGVIYVSISHNVAIHRCCCGCGYEVVTPISPSGWTITYDGEAITLSPSIGNWNLRCKSHYWIRFNNVINIPHRDNTTNHLKSQKKKKKHRRKKRT